VEGIRDQYDPLTGSILDAGTRLTRRSSRHVPCADAMCVPLPPASTALAGLSGNLVDAWRPVAPHLGKDTTDVLVLGPKGTTFVTERVRARTAMPHAGSDHGRSTRPVDVRDGRRVVGGRAGGVGHRGGPPSGATDLWRFPATTRFE
jgi:hypothetical protein